MQPNCAACQSGEQHRSYVLYGRHQGRRFAIYVPEDLIDEVRRAVDNGRALQDLLMQAGPRYVKALKRARESKPTPRPRVGASGRAAGPAAAGHCDLLDQNHEVLERVQRDLYRGLKNPGKGRHGLTARQVVGALVLTCIKNWDYRELRERIADGVTCARCLWRFTTPC
jgi:hypothetical protein